MQISESKVEGILKKQALTLNNTGEKQHEIAEFAFWSITGETIGQ